jgi:hypothetical protein
MILFLLSVCSLYAKYKWYEIELNIKINYDIRICKSLVCVCLMVFDATFNNISVISWQSVLLVDETKGPAEKHLPVASH